MSARILQQSLVNELAELFKDSRYKAPGGEDRAPAVFRQLLPKREAEDDDDPFPYLIVRLDNGTVNVRDYHTVMTLVLVGVFDDSPENNGHDAVIEMLEKIQARYQQNPFVRNRQGQIVATVNRDNAMTWALQDEESFPYFFGGMNLFWDLTAPRQEVSDLT